MENDNVKFKIRVAARAVIYDKENAKIAVLEVKGGAYHKIPGGGVEPGEEAEDAARREAIEEGACDVEIIRKIGVSDLQYTGDAGKLDQSHSFLALKTADQPGNSFTVEEKKDDFKLLWLGFDEAIKRFETPKTNIDFELTINKRDLGFVMEAKKILIELKI